MKMNLNSKLEDIEVFPVFAWWSGILLLKMILMSLLTARQRFRKEVFTSPEDTAFSRKAKVTFSDPDVERVRRAHQNDLENILPWTVATWLYLGTDPAPWLAALLIRTFAISRIIHTIVYAVVPLPQPSRVLAFGVAYAVVAYQIIITLIHYSGV